MKKRLNEVNRLQKLAGILIKENNSEVKNPPFTWKTASIEKDEEGKLLSIEYTFSTGKINYKALFDSFENPGDFRLTFGRNRGENMGLDTDEMTSEGVAMRILRTIADIVNKFYEKYNDQIKSIEIKGTSEKRTKIYNLVFPKLIDATVMNKVNIA